MRIDEMPVGRPRVALADRPRAAPEQLARELGRGDTQTAMLPVPFPAAAGASSFSDALLGALVDLARQMWPRWYGADAVELARGPGPEAALRNQQAITTLAARRPRVAKSWLREVLAAVGRGATPRARDVPDVVQAEQLAEVIDLGADLLLMPVFEGPIPDEAALAATLDRAGQLADAAHARMLLVLPRAWAGLDPLERLAYGALDLAPAPAPSPAEPPHAPRLVSIGRPDPSSEGECRLAAALARVPELGALFAFNRVVETIFGDTPRVDLVWADGKVAVEIDGWGHQLQGQYADDRERDFRLLASGYVVLRIPHEEAAGQTDRAVEKIRRVVEVRRRQGIGK